MTGFIEVSLRRIADGELQLRFKWVACHDLNVLTLDAPLIHR
jgi:hypothetical protein